MKLLNTRTIQLEDFLDGSIPPYAILSHRWQKEELSFRDLKPKFVQSLPSKPGYAKVYHFCKTALRDGFEYGWVDTTCIDKSSSAELSEAINSMFRWYQDATTCYVYMDTVPSSKNPDEVDHDQLQAFHLSEWFLRGWTLQELLAPEHVLFLDCNWIKFGTKDSLAREISLITNIEKRFLIDSSRSTLGGYLANAPCVATIMSWASVRNTSRKEDMAYCLLGLFDINMPLLYGEGEKAFSRLQLEIIRKTDDETIFAWRGGGKSLLAPSPKSFVNCQDLQPLNFDIRFYRPPYSITNQGLEIQGELIEQRRELIERRRELSEKRGTKMSHYKLLPLRVALVKRGTKFFCAIGIEEYSPYFIETDEPQTKRLRRADSDAIYECSWEGRDPASSITTIVRTATLQGRTGDRPLAAVGAGVPSQDVTNDFYRPTAANSSSKLVRQLLYLSLSEDLYLGRAYKNRTAISVAGSEDRYVTHTRDESKAYRLGYKVPMGARSAHSAGGTYEHGQQGTSEPIYRPNPRELRAKLAGSKDEHVRQVLPSTMDVPILRVPSGRREHPSYG